jgi:hypothetical protein
MIKPTWNFMGFFFLLKKISAGINTRTNEIAMIGKNKYSRQIATPIIAYWHLIKSTPTESGRH